MRFLDGPRPRIFAHRGASHDAPENTLEAFELALRQGAERLELDVHASRDGEVVVFHDPDLDRTTDGAGPVRNATLAELRRLDAGARRPDWAGRGTRVPTLNELLERVPGVPLNIEVKQSDPPIVDRVLAVLDRHGESGHTLLAAEDHAIMVAIRAAAPEMLTSFSAVEVADFVYRLRDGCLGRPGEARAVVGDSWQPAGVALQVPASFGEVEIVSRESVEAAHSFDVEVHVWTVDEPAEMARLIDLGVDGIITNVPAVAVQLFRERGLR